MSKRINLKLLTLKIASCICLSGFIGVHAQEVFEEGASSLETSYLESKDALDDYILDTEDILVIRFKNRPRKGFTEGLEKDISSRDISYLEPRDSLDNYVLDTGDSIFIDFNINSDSEYDSNVYTIDKEGEVYLPEIKTSYVKGLTIAELKILLEKRYAEYLVSPNIDIRVSNFKFIPNGIFPINEEGELLLPAIATDPDENTRKTFVRGLTTKELEQLLEKRYSEYLLSPKVFIEVISYKPIRISLMGEVRSPGIIKFPAYSTSSFFTILNNSEQNEFVNNPERKFNVDNLLERSQSYKEFQNNREKISNKSNNKFLSSQKSIDSDSTSFLDNNLKKDSEYLTTISNAIQRAGGLTSYSDLSKIIITRDIPLGKGGGKKRAIIDFRSFIKEADDTYDIRIFDGDSIFIPSLQEKDPTIISNSILAGLSPRFIQVSILGQVENPGLARIPIEGSLSDAINLSGPRKPLSGKINLIRYNQDGTILRKNIRYSAGASPGSVGNPFLLSGDLITVKNSIVGRASGTIRAFTEPFIGIYATRELVDKF